MKKYIKKSLKASNGITLIALVITIIVLLILAGISISMLSGDNGILQRATDAKENTDVAQIQERINLAYHSALVDGQGEVTETSLEIALKNEFNKTTLSEDWLDKTSIDGKWKITIDGISLEVPAGIENDNDVIIKVGSTNLKDVADLSTLYGETTNYVSTSHPDIDWQLFYSDTSNYYLIASDYVPNAELPCNGNRLNGITFGETDLVKVDGSEYKAKFCSSTSYNDGILSTGTIYKNGSTSTAITGNSLSITYLKWATTYNTSTNNNICSVAYMMDTNKWASFADGAGASYAIGGPTVEMLSKSWNAVSGHEQMADYTTLSSSNSDANGYIVETPGNVNNFFGTATNMWFIKESTKATFYWVASPSYLAANNLCAVNRFGAFASGYASVHLGGFRPLVVIPKNN